MAGAGLHQELYSPKGRAGCSGAHPLGAMASLSPREELSPADGNHRHFDVI